MAEIPAVKISECLGWRLADDKQIVLLGFQDDKGQTFNLAIDEPSLKTAVVSLLDATAAFPKQKMEAGPTWAFATGWFEFFATESGGEFLRLRLPSGGNLSFSLAPGMTTNMRDVLVAKLGPGSSNQKPDSAKH